MMDYDEQGRRIANLLKAGDEGLTPEQLSKLAQAREVALSRRRAESVRVAEPAFAGALRNFTERPVFGVRYVIPVAALVLGLIGITYMHASPPANDIADIDAHLLTDDLPISAYLDSGFDSWLKRSGR